MEKKITIEELADIENPCLVPWSYMKGDDISRYCEACDLNVHNLSALNSNEIDVFVETHRGQNVCINVNYDERGAVKTDTRPAFVRWSLKAIRKCGHVALVAFFALLSFVAPVWAQKSSGTAKNQQPPAAQSPEWSTALESFRAGRIDDAITRFRSLSIKDTTGKSNYYLGLCLQSQKKYVEAKVQFVMAESRAGTDLQLKKNAQQAGLQVVQAMAKPDPTVVREPACNTKRGKIAMPERNDSTNKK